MATLSRLGQQLALAAFVVAAVTSVVFLLLHLIPGDPVDVMLGEYAATADRVALRARLGLDRPLPEQWLHFAAGVARLDLGPSLSSGQPIVATVMSHLAWTALLAGAALAVAVVCGVPLGVLAAVRRGSAFDTASSVLAVVGLSVPNFVLGPLLILVFALQLGWLPTGGADRPSALILLTVTLGVSLVSG